MKTLKNIIYFVAFYFLQQIPTLLISLQMGKNHSGFSQIISSIGILISFIIIPALFVHYYNERSQEISKFNKSAFLMVILAVILNLIINELSLPFMKLTGNANVDALQAIMQANPLLMIIYAVIVGPILEELLFRGLFMNMFFVNKPWISWFVSSIIFGVMHTSNDPVYLLSKILLGMVLGFVYLKTKNIKANIAVHIINNISAFFIG